MEGRALMIHKMNLHVYYQDTDAGGIVYHSKYLDFAERARSELLFDMGLSNTTLINQGIALVLRHIIIDYKRPARLDDLLTIETTITEIRNASMFVTQRFLRGEEGIVNIQLQLAFINPKTMLPIRIPSEIKTLFNTYN